MQVNLSSYEKVKYFARTSLTGFITIKHKNDLIGNPFETLQMLFANCRSKDGESVCYALLVRHDYIGVAFPDKDAAVLTYGVHCQVQAVEFLTLFK